MPGKFVFPGGRIEALDATMSAVSEIHPDMAGQAQRARRQCRARNSRARWRLTAIREVAEETGLLLGVKGSTPPQTPGEIWSEFAKARCIPTWAISISSPAPSRRRAGRAASTPAFSPPMRPPSRTQIEGVVGPDSELVELAWVPIEEAAHLDMPTITGIVLEELLARVEAGMGQRCRCRSISWSRQQFSGSCCKTLKSAVS